MLLGALYATSACVMFGATVYFAVKRGETFEAAQRITGPVSFIVKYSRNGEPVNLYLRLGLACKFRYFLNLFICYLVSNASNQFEYEHYGILICFFKLTNDIVNLKLHLKVRWWLNNA